MINFVGVPIGNLDDITLRAFKVLTDSTIILSEDTRVTKKLIQLLNIQTKAKVIRYNENNPYKIHENIKDIWQEEKISFVTDAGMPGISDPGKVLVNYLQDNQIEYTIIPGVSALATAISAAGFKAPFIFNGFLPKKASQIQKQLINDFKHKATLIYYVSVHDFLKTIQEIKDIANLENKICICRELTKRNEEIIVQKIGQINVENIVMKGEFVILIENENLKEQFSQSIEQFIKTNYLKAKSQKELIALGIIKGFKKNELYEQIINFKKEQDEE